VYDPEGFETEPVGFGKILFDNSLYIPGRHAVEVEDIRDWNSNGVHKKPKARSTHHSEPAGP
jgi:hypothetical protein